jgi:2-polyprenyl-3-methyl-5-hydroxy-6-metoxy-1,4-benzoquinol methylase
MENCTGTAGPRLAQFADIDANDKVWDVACGTGVVALTAARCGLSVTTANLTSALIKRAKETQKILFGCGFTRMQRGGPAFRRCKL